MVRNSRHIIKKEVLKGIYQLFFEVVSKGKNKNDFFQIFDEIISPSEKIMIAKRVAIIYLLANKINIREIVNTLKVSSATVAKYVLLFSNHESRLINIFKIILKNRKVKNFLIDIFSDLIIQPGIKIGHWKLYKQHENEKNNVFRS